MIELSFNLGLIPLLAAFCLPLLSTIWRDRVLIIIPALLLLLLLLSILTQSSTGAGAIVQIKFGTSPFSGLFATIFSLALLLCNIFAFKTARTLELCGAMICAGGAIYASLCDSLFALFIACELMLVGSVAILFSARTKQSRDASLRYFFIHFVSGFLLLIGIAGIITTTGDTGLRNLDLENTFAWFVLASFLINAGAPPFSALIADAYPEASPTGAVYLSVFTTKVAVFAMLSLFAGQALLIPIGIYMIFYGIVYAFGENNIRRILAYSIVNQVGFMMVGIGIGSSLALYGAGMHAFAHILYKSLLMMSAGAVLLQTGRSRCTDLGGLYRTMRITAICGIIGALAISFPLTAGFVSKPMIPLAALEENQLWLWLILTLASAGVCLHAGMKFPWFVFFQKDAHLRATDPPANMCFAMCIVAALCLLFGIFPSMLYALQASSIVYTPYTSGSVVTKLQLLLFSGAAFFAFLPLLNHKHKTSLDWDWFYRSLLPIINQHFVQHADALLTSLQKNARHLLSVARDLTKTKAIDLLMQQNIASHSMTIGLMIVLSFLLFLVLK